MEPRDNLKYLAVAHNTSKAILSEFAQDIPNKDMVFLSFDKLFHSL